MQRQLAPRARVLAVALPTTFTVAAVALGIIAAYLFTLGLDITRIESGLLGLPVAWGLPTPALLTLALAVLAATLLASLTLETVDILTARPRAITPTRRSVTVVIPAHNEAARLTSCLASVELQSRRPDRVIVVADDCTDTTADIAEAAGVEVLVTIDNAGRKAGALNQALEQLLADLGEGDIVVVMDADTELSSGFVEAALDAFDSDRELSAAGGVFLGDERRGLWAQLQRNEFHRYARTIRARRGRVFVLTGTATAFRVDALRSVAAARGTCLPGRAGSVYDPDAITEDNELTLALKSLGAPMASPPGCIATTEVMPDLGSLWTQRSRWMRGALENVGTYGLRPYVWRYWIQQCGLAYTSLALVSALAVLIIAPVVNGWVWLPFWLAVGAAFIVERVATAWRAGWKGRLLAATLVPELAYDLVLLAAHTASIASIAANRGDSWGHLDDGRRA